VLHKSSSTNHARYPLLHLAVCFCAGVILASTVEVTPLFFEALKCVVNAKRGSTSLLQRHLRIGYGRAAAILDAMVKEGYIGDMDGSSRARPVLQKAYDDLQDLAEMNQ
jgi:DNA segregation ATPase FtsK/SpoIIIE-like protein